MEEEFVAISPGCNSHRQDDRSAIVDCDMSDARAVEDLQKISPVMALLMGKSLDRGSALLRGVACHREESNLAA